LRSSAAAAAGWLAAASCFVAFDADAYVD